MTTAAQRDQAIKDLQVALAAETKARIAGDAALVSSDDVIVDAINSLQRRVEALEGADPPPPPPPTGKSLTVTSVAGILAALKDDTLDTIVVKNGTYAIKGAGFQATNSLWIGSDTAGRTRPVTVIAETKFGVTFDGGGSALGGISFEEGAHHQTWDGFVFANGTVSQTGLIVAGGYPGLASAHHITMRNIKVLASIRGSGNTAQGYATDHAIYGAHAAGAGPNNFLFEDIDIDCSGGLASGFHFYHSESGNPNCSYWTTRRFVIKRAQQGLILWDSTMHDMVFEDGTITDSSQTAVTYHNPTRGNKLTRVNSTGSGQTGLYAPSGQAGLTLNNCSLA